MSDLESLITSLKEIKKSVGKAILEVYHAAGGVEVETKSDDSPVTKTDRVVHAV